MSGKLERANSVDLDQTCGPFKVLMDVSPVEELGLDDGLGPRDACMAEAGSVKLK